MFILTVPRTGGIAHHTGPGRGAPGQPGDTGGEEEMWAPPSLWFPGKEWRSSLAWQAPGIKAAPSCPAAGPAVLQEGTVPKGESLVGELVGMGPGLVSLHL